LLCIDGTEQGQISDVKGSTGNKSSSGSPINTDQGDKMFNSK
jgi:hypothetical protein